MQKLVRLVLSLAVVWYVLFGVVLALFEKRMVYFPDAQDFESCAGFLDAEKITYKGTRFYYKHIHDEKAVVFYHGNGGSACDRSVLKDTFEEAGFSYLFVEYPGYAGPVRGKPPEVAGGGSRASNGAGDREGPSKTRILAGVLTVQQFIEQEGYREVVLVGESIGVGVAGYHASLAKPDRLILISPHYELADLAGWIGHLYPVRLLMRENYTPGTWLKGVSVPTLLIEAEDDEIVPAWSADKLYTTIESATRVELPGTHNALYENPEFYRSIERFLEY